MPAWLTLVRKSDLALTFATAELLDDHTFRFVPELPGPGEDVAVLEFHPWPDTAAIARPAFAITVDDDIVAD